MELLEIYDLAMHALIAKMQEPEVSAEEQQDLTRKLKHVADLYVREQSNKFLENFNKPIDK